MEPRKPSKKTLYLRLHCITIGIDEEIDEDIVVEAKYKMVDEARMLRRWK